MMIIKNIESKIVITILSFAIILFIGMIDYITGAEISFSIFYLIPIILIALYKQVKKNVVIINAIFASVVWFVADFYARKYSNVSIPIWNAIVRLSIFVLVGLLVLNYKEKYKKLIQANKDLVRLNAEKNKFIGIAAHDLRSPIGNIQSFADIILSEYKNIDVQIIEIVNYIKELSDNTLELLKKLLNISAIESGTIVTNPKYQNYTQFIERQVYFNQILATKKEIRIKYNATLTDINFYFDENYMSEVINNLLTNAIKFSYPKSEVLVNISITENNYVKTEIIDQGKGIVEEEQLKLFNYFQKSSTMPTAGEQSTGLGLAIVKKIITEHKGKVGVISKINYGSNFYFELPI